MKTAKDILLENIPKDCWWEEMENLTNTPVEYVTKAMESFAAQSVREDRESRWISVEERLPEGHWANDSLLTHISEQVNVFVDNGNVGTAAYNRETGKWFIGDLTKDRYQEFRNTVVTHWQPLPEKP